MADLESIAIRARESRLGRWLLAYAGPAVIVAGLLEAVASPWGLSDLTIRRIHLVLLFGLPTAGILAWYHGRKGRQAVQMVEMGLLAALWILGSTIIWRLDGDAPTRRAGLNREGPAVAVLALEHRAPDEQRAYVTSGIHETLTHALEEVSGLLVTSRASVMSLPAELSMTEAARELGVDYIVTGSVQWAAAEFRLSLELTDVVNGGRALWADRYVGIYDRPDQVYDLPNTVVRQVARSVRVSVLPPEQERLAGASTDNRLAFDLYMRARAKRAGEDRETEEAIELLETAVATDPGFAAAWGLLAHRLFILERWEEGEAALVRADELDPESREALLSHAFHTYRREHDYRRAVSNLEEIVEARPNFSEAVLLLGAAYRRTGQWDRAIEYFEAGLDLEPRNSFFTLLLAEAHYMMGNHEAGLTVADRVTALGGSGGGFSATRTALWGLGDTILARQANEATPPGPGKDWWRAVIAETRGDTATARRIHFSAPPAQLERAAFLYTYDDRAAAKVHADSARNALEARLAQCPPGDRGFCRDLAHASLGWAYIFLGDFAEAERHLLRAAVELRPPTRDAYNGPARLGRLAAGYAWMGRWEDATRVFDEVLSRPGYQHAAFLRLSPALAKLREAYPPFTEMLDRYDPPDS